MKNRFKNVKVGQKLWSTAYGKGTVVEDNDGFENSIRVQFNSGTIVFNIRGQVKGRLQQRTLFFKKPVITTKKRLSHLINEAEAKAYVKGQHSGYREARRILKLEFEEELQSRIKTALTEHGLDPDTEVTIKGRSVKDEMWKLYGLGEWKNENNNG